MYPTIKDVAKEAKVSIATVSLVIHNNGRITQETRKKVLKAIKKLNYHPSRSARGLVSSTTGNIGFILTEDHFLKTEPFYTKIFLGTEFEARAKDYYKLLATGHELVMPTGYDDFTEKAGHNYSDLSEEARRNRALLKEIMMEL